MTMTSLIRTGFSGLSLRNTSSKEGGGGERAAGWKNGRFWVGTDMEEFVPDAAGSVKAVWSRKTAPNASTASISPSLGGRTPSVNVACKLNSGFPECLYKTSILGLITLLLFFFFLTNNSCSNLSEQGTCKSTLSQVYFAPFWFFTYCLSRYRRCVRIEKGKMERVIKPFKGIFLNGPCLFLTVRYVVCQINHEPLSQSRRGVFWKRFQAATKETGVSVGTARVPH